MREALDKFAADAHEENMLAMASAIMGHAVTQGRAAGLEEERAKFEKWARLDEMNPTMRVVWVPPIEFAWNAWQAGAALSSLPSEDAQGDLLTVARDALEEIALAGMSGSGQESEESMRDWHARRAWEFISIAARAKTAIDAAIAAQGERG